MGTSTEPPLPREERLDRLAEQYVWGTMAEQAALAEQLCALLGRQDDEDFDLDAWAIDRVERRRGDPEMLWDDDPFVVCVGTSIGLAMGQWWNTRGELITALQLHPGERQVLVEGGIAEVEHADLVDVMRREITAALTRARFLGLDSLTVGQLAEEGLAASDAHDYEALRADVRSTPTLGDGEGVRRLVRVVGVELLADYRVKLAFDDGVARVIDLEPFLRRPGRAAIRQPTFFIQLRVEDGTIGWPNGLRLDPVALRYFPAIQPDGTEA